MKILIDNQLPASLAEHLRRKGHECVHVSELGLGKAQDIEIWEHAGRDGSVVISKDEDFVFLANRLNDRGQLVWVRLGNCRNAILLAKLNEVHDALVAAIESGRRIFELR